MPKAAGTGWKHYWLTVAAVWIAAGAAAWIYARQEHIPSAILWAALPAFLAEIALYLAPGFAGVRTTLARIRPSALRALFVTGAALVPYPLAAVRLGGFRWEEFGLLAALAAVLSFWYVAAKPGALADCLFLGFVAGVYLSRVFSQIYPSPAPHLQLETLGRLMWIHTGILAVLCIRGWEAGFGFVPTAREWRIGAEQFMLFLPAGGAVAYFLHAVKFHMASPIWWKVPLIVVGTFFAFLWVTALAEEFFFRGFLQQLLARAWNSNLAALLVASAVFGLAHLPFRGFPNWRWVAVATVLGVSCGIAYWRSGSVRASMVTHALVVATWRGFFAG